ncbi:MAG TPA: crotonase/enoyl-CoA hydratase family protein [Microthrixaceae bacterium]|nr:crotonase/enoyl-CoA hydratase family protein [Microthrixaceae bacterium]
MPECFDVEVTDGVAHLRLNRPDALNTMTPDFWRELPELLDEIDRNASARVVVLSSTGRHFSAGMDLAVFTGGSDLLTEPGVSEAGRRRAHLFQTVLKLQDVFTKLEAIRQPVLAAVQGGCIGGAVDLVCAADMRYATADSFFCVQEINIGMTADVGTLQRLPKLIPEGVARELAYTGDRMPAARAKDVGLVNEVFADHDALIEGVLDIAARIAAHSPLAVWGTKEVVNFARDHTVGDSLRYMAAWQSGMFQPGDMMEEFAAKAERRTPSFEDLGKRP